MGRLEQKTIEKNVFDLILGLFSARHQLAAEPSNHSVSGRREPATTWAEKICPKRIERKYRRGSKQSDENDDRLNEISPKYFYSDIFRTKT